MDVKKPLSPFCNSKIFITYTRTRVHPREVLSALLDTLKEASWKSKKLKIRDFLIVTKFHNTEGPSDKNRHKLGHTADTYVQVYLIFSEPITVSEHEAFDLSIDGYTHASFIRSVFNAPRLISAILSDVIYDSEELLLYSSNFKKDINFMVNNVGWKKDMLNFAKGGDIPGALKILWQVDQKLFDKNMWGIKASLLFYYLSKN